MIEYLNMFFSFLIEVNAFMVFGIVGFDKIYQFSHDTISWALLVSSFLTIFMACVTLCLFVGAISIFNVFGVIWLGYIVGIFGIVAIDCFFIAWSEDRWF